MKHYTLKLEPLTILHIGTGNLIEPHEYTIYDNNKKPLYLRINFETIFEAIENEKTKQKLIQILSTSGDFIQFRSVLQKEASELFEKCYIYGSHVTNEFAAEFRSKFEDRNNQLALFETYRPPLAKKPYIPGSSIKGAIRTAILNKHADKIDSIRFTDVKKKAEYASRSKVDTDFQKALLEFNDAKEDPFRILRISDGKVQGKHPMIVGTAYNVSVKDGELRKSRIPIYLETIRGLMADGDAYVEVKVSFLSELFQASRAYSKFVTNDKKFKNITLNISVDDIIQSCNTFYKKIWTTEFNKFYSTCDAGSGVWTNINKAIAEIGKNNNKEFLLRIGRFSHFEAVTVEKFRRALKGFGRSRTLFSYKNALLPMGWVRATIMEG